MKSFYKGTLILIVAAFFGECIEFLVNMLLARELHEEGMGLYMSILPIFFLIYVIASLELHISISNSLRKIKQAMHYNLIIHALKMAAVVVIGNVCSHAFHTFLLIHNGQIPSLY